MEGGTYASKIVHLLGVITIYPLYYGAWAGGILAPIVFVLMVVYTYWHAADEVAAEATFEYLSLVYIEPYLRPAIYALMGFAAIFAFSMVAVVILQHLEKVELRLRNRLG